MRWYAREYVNCLYMMKYANQNSQSQVWNGIVSTSKQNTWTWLSSSTLATTWTTANQTSPMRLFWLENWWWNLSEWCVGIHTASWNYDVATALWKNSNDNTTTVDWTYYKQLSVGSAIWTDWRPSTAMAGDNKWMFVWTSVYSSQDWSKGYCDRSKVNSGYIASVSGHYGSGLDAGAFSLNVDNAPSFSNAHHGSRLVYL